MNYPLIKKLGLVVRWDEFEYVGADELEEVLDKATKVRGNLEGAWCFSTGEFSSDTHTGILLMVEPIEKVKPVSKSEIVQTLRLFGAKDKNEATAVLNLVERIEEAGIES